LTGYADDAIQAEVVAFVRQLLDRCAEAEPAVS
jgi:hypothetical protein